MTPRPSRLLALLALPIALVGLWLWRVEPEEPFRSVLFEEATHSADPAGTRGKGETRGSSRSEASVPRFVPQDPRDDGGLPIHLYTVRSKTPRDPIGRVALEVGVGPLAPESVVAHVITDREGFAAVVLPREAVEAARAAREGRYWVRIVGKGFVQRVKTRGLPAPGGAALQLTVVPGATVRGRLLDGEGKPAAGQVSARMRTPQGYRSLGSRAEAGPDGRFELHVTRAGEFQILAGATQGTACLRNVTVDFDDPPQDLELRLRGPGSLSGVIRDSRGQPASGLEVQVLLAELDNARGSAGVFAAREDELQLEGAGMLFQRVQTDSKGRFRCRGLRADRYVVRVRTGAGADSQGFPHRLTPIAVDADGAELELSFDRPSIVVTVKTADGALVNDLEPGIPRFGTRVQRLLVASPCAGRDAKTLEPIAARLSDGEFAIAGRRSDGEFVFEVPDGRSFRVGVFGSDWLWEPVHVDVPEGSGRIPVELEVRPAGAAAVLRVSALDHEGLSTQRVRIRVEDVDSRLRLIDRRDDYWAAWPLRLEFPQGRYRLVVEGTPQLNPYHGWLEEPTFDGRFETLVALREGEERDVQASLPAGGRVRLTLEGETRAEDRDALVADLRRRGLSTTEATLDDWGTRATLTLLTEGDWPRPLEFVHDLGGFVGTQVVPTLPIGTTGTSLVVPTGTYLLEARMPAGRLARREIVVHESGITTVTLRPE